MKRKEVMKLRSLSTKELEKEISDVEKQLATMNIDRYTKQSKNTRARKERRGRIAVLKTIRNEITLSEKVG